MTAPVPFEALVDDLNTDDPAQFTDARARLIAAHEDAVQELRVEKLRALSTNVALTAERDALKTEVERLVSGSAEPVGYIYEIASFYNKTTDEYSGWKKNISFTAPNAGRGQRNVTPLYALPQVRP